MDDQEEDNCTTTNLSTDDNVELRGIISKVVTSAGGDALPLFPRFHKLVRDKNFCVNIYQPFQNPPSVYLPSNLIYVSIRTLSL